MLCFSRVLASWAWRYCNSGLDSATTRAYPTIPHLLTTLFIMTPMVKGSSSRKVISLGGVATWFWESARDVGVDRIGELLVTTTTGYSKRKCFTVRIPHRSFRRCNLQGKEGRCKRTTKEPTILRVLGANHLKSAECKDYSEVMCLRLPTSRRIC